MRIWRSCRSSSRGGDRTIRSTSADVCLARAAADRSSDAASGSAASSDRSAERSARAASLRMAWPVSAVGLAVPALVRRKQAHEVVLQIVPIADDVGELLDKAAVAVVRRGTKRQHPERTVGFKEGLRFGVASRKDRRPAGGLRPGGGQLSCSNRSWNFDALSTCRGEMPRSGRPASSRKGTSSNSFAAPGRPPAASRIFPSLGLDEPTEEHFGGLAAGQQPRALAAGDLLDGRAGRNCPGA